MSTPELPYSNTSPEYPVITDCALSPEEVGYLRSSHGAYEVQDACYSANIDCIDVLATSLALPLEAPNTDWYTTYPVLSTEGSDYQSLFDQIQAESSLDQEDKFLLKAVLVARVLLKSQDGHHQQTASSPDGHTDLLPGGDAGSLKHQICSVAFWQKLLRFQESQQITDEQGLLGPKTLSALLASKSDQEAPEEGALHQSFSEFGFQHLVDKETENTGEQAYLCSLYTNSILTDALFKQGVSYRFPKELPARKKQDDFSASCFETRQIDTLSQQALQEFVSTCPVGTTITVQNSRSIHIAKGVTHTLIHLGGGSRSEAVGNTLRTHENLASLIEKNESDGTWCFRISEHVTYNLLPSSKAYIPLPELMEKVTFVPLDEDTFVKLQRNYGANTLGFAKYLSTTYGGSYAYYYSLLVASPTTIQVPIPEQKTGGPGGESLLKASPRPTTDHTLRFSTEHPLPSFFEECQQLFRKIGLKQLPQVFVCMLAKLYKQERASGKERGLVEQYLSSEWYRKNKDAAPHQFIRDQLRKKGQQVLADGADPQSLGPFQLNISTTRKLLKQNPEVLATLHKLLKAQKIKTTNLFTEYTDMRTILYNKPIALYLAGVLLTKNVAICAEHAQKGGVFVSEADKLLTAQMMYNKGPQAVYGAVLQQELFRLASMRGCRPLPTSFVFDGVSGKQTDALLVSLKQHGVLEGDVSLKKNAKGTITGLRTGENDLLATDTAGLIAYFRDCPGYAYAPALRFDFLQQQYKLNPKVRPHYVYSMLTEAQRVKKKNLYAEDCCIDQGDVKSGNRLSLFRSFLTNTQLSFRRPDLDGKATYYTPSTHTGKISDLDLIQLWYAPEPLTDNWKETLPPGLETPVHLASLLSRHFTPQVTITPDVYADFSTYTHALTGVKIGQVVRVGKGNTLLSGIVSKIALDAKGRIVNVSMISTHGSATQGGSGPKEVALFGPGGLYEKTLFRKQELQFGYLQPKGVTTKTNQQQATEKPLSVY